MKDKKEFWKRVAALLLGTCAISIGIALLSKANIGMTPISSVPFVMSNAVPALTLGNWVLIWNIVFAALQIPVMGRNYKAYLLLQFPLAFLLGYVTDFAKYLLSGLTVEAYILKLLVMLIGICFTGTGVFMTVRAKLIMNGPEAFLHALSNRYGWKFGTLKIIFDSSNVVMAAVLSLILFHTVIGIREGTLCAALLVGVVVNIWGKIFPQKK